MNAVEKMHHDFFAVKQVEFDYPSSVFVSNGEIFIADSGNHRVRKYLRNGQTVTICGTDVQGYNGDGIPATEAQLCKPTSVFVSSSNQVYISDDYGHRIRKIDQFGIISTIAGTGDCGYSADYRDDVVATSAKLKYPYGLFVTDTEEVLFCDDKRVRKIDHLGMLRTIIGNGERDDTSILAKNASIYPNSIFVYKNEIYVADYFHHQIKKVDKDGYISIVAGKEYIEEEYQSETDDEIVVQPVTTVPEVDGQPATLAEINPNYIFVHDDEIYFTEIGRVRKIDRNGIIRTIAGTGEDGFSGDGQLAIHAKVACRALFVTENSEVIIADDTRIRKIDQRSGIISTIVGRARVGYKGDVAYDFKQFPHIGQKKKVIKPFPKACYDISILIQHEY